MTVLIIGGEHRLRLSQPEDWELKTILEKPRLGKRYWLQETALQPDQPQHLSWLLLWGDPEFVESIYHSLMLKPSFFEKLGIAHKVEDEGKVFPMSPGFQCA